MPSSGLNVQAESQRPGEKANGDLLTWLYEGLSWRWRFKIKPRIKTCLGIRNVQWARVVSDRAAENFVRSIPFKESDVLEISPGSERWRYFGFKSYLSTSYPAYDVCSGPFERQAFDLVFAEQVLEHVEWPYRAVRNVWQMLRPNGWFIISTPFLIRVHSYPNDCSRWTEQGMKYLLMEGGFSEENIELGSWGNRACVIANFRTFRSWIPWLHSLRNDPRYPVVVWGFAHKSAQERATNGLAGSPDSHRS